MFKALRELTNIYDDCRQNPSRNPSQCSSREGLDSRLESPSLLRKVIGGQHSAGLDLESPPSSPAPAFNNPTNSFHHSQKFSNFSLQENGNKTSSQVNISVNTRPNNSLNISNGGSNSSSGQYNNQSLLSAIKTTSSMLEESVERGFTDRRTEEDRLTWLQKQQRKLEERREEQKRSQQESQYLIKELKTSLQRARSGGTETTDGYVSDAASMLYSETSRESSPAKQSFSVPLRVETDSLYSSVQKRSQRARHDSESEAELANFSRSAINGSSNSIDSAGAMFHPANRSTTPAFPPTASTPYFNQSSTNLPPKSPMFQSRGNSRVDLTARAPSPAGSVYQAEPGLSMSRRGSLSSEPTEVAPSHVKLVKDRNRFWYRPTISREEAISVLRAQPPGTFIVRDSNSFPGAFGLALKVSTLPQNSNRSGSDPNSELVRHFLIEPTSKGVKLKGYPNEPVFASLSALIYQHTITALALPAKLVLPQYDLGGDNTPDQTSASAQMQQLLQLGAACNVFYLFSMDTDQLTGPQAVRKTVSQLFLTRPLPSATVVHFKVSGQGITLTDQARKLFFRKHYNTPQISHCGVDPEDRRWSVKTSVPPLSNRLFAFVARKPTSRACNQCHVFAELDTEQPARAIVNFVNKVMLSGNTNTISSGRAVDMV